MLLITCFAGLLVLTRTHHRATVPAGPHPTALPTIAPSVAPTPAASPTAVASAFAAPDSVPAVVFSDPADRAQLDAVTWDGSGLGRLATNGTPNPAGTLFVTTTSVTDRQGRLVASVSVTGKAPPAWADDGHTLCRSTPAPGLQPSGTPASLQIAAVGGGWRTVGRYGVVAENVGVDIARTATFRQLISIWSTPPGKRSDCQPRSGPFDETSVRRMGLT